jgi:hypothetical protein
MMGVSVGEEVDPQIVPVLYDQMGFERPVPRKQIDGRRTPPAGFRVLVIGGGMTGIAAGIKLEEAGYDYTIIEKNPELGGTWWENRYPGVGVDTPSHFYSYSFELNPDWTTYHPKGPEIQGYLTGVAEKYGIRKHVRFSTTVVSAVWDDATNLWKVTLKSPDGAIGRERQRCHPGARRAQPLVDARYPGARHFHRAQDAHSGLGSVDRREGQARRPDRNWRQCGAVRPGRRCRRGEPGRVPALEALGDEQSRHQSAGQRQHPLRAAQYPALQGMVPLSRLLVHR